MKRALLLAASALVLTAFVPEQADAQGRRFGVRGGVVRGPVYAYPRGYYGYRRGYYRPGVGAAVGLGVLGAAALRAAADHVARLQRRREHLLDVGAERLPRHGPIEHKWCDDPARSQARHDGRSLPVAKRRCI